MASQQGLTIVEETDTSEAETNAQANLPEGLVQVESVKKRGRPLGSKNKKTLEREAKEKEEQERLAHKRGRKPGSKNKKTLEREAAAQAEAKRLSRNAKRRAAYARKKAEVTKEKD